MAKTYSNMIPLGEKAVPFSLPDVISGEMVHLASCQGAPATVLMFICNHCPYVKHINATLVEVANDYQPQGVIFLAINANDITQYPDDSPANMLKTAKDAGYPFPYLFDESQDVARAYKAACTPDFYVYDARHCLVYRGQIDASRPGNDVPSDGSSLRQALQALLHNEPVSLEQTPSLGCNIKWKNADLRAADKSLV